MAKRKTPKPIGGGWYLLPDGRTKVQGFDAAYGAAGLDPERYGNRRSAAARQRRRKPSMDERRFRVAALFVEKVPYREIARMLGVAPSTVSDDIAAIREDWRASALRDVGDYVIDELATLEHDEYRLRLRYRAQGDDVTKMRIYDRIAKIMDRRAARLGLDAPTVRRHVLVGDDDGEYGGERVVFRVGGTKDEYIAALRAAQGRLPVEERSLKIVKRDG